MTLREGQVYHTDKRGSAVFWRLPGRPGSWAVFSLGDSLPGFAFPSLLPPQSVTLPGTDSLTKIFLILSFLIVSMQLMELYLQHFFFFFFRIHNFKKPYNITSFNRKKALIEKEDTRNMVVLTLLPKIDILRLTKRHHTKKGLLESALSLRHLTSYTTQSRAGKPTSPPRVTATLPGVLQLHAKIHTVSELVPKY